MHMRQRVARVRLRQLILALLQLGVDNECIGDRPISPFKVYEINQDVLKTSGPNRNAKP